VGLLQRLREEVAASRTDSPAPSLAKERTAIRTGDLAKQIHAHLAACRVCRLEYYVTDSPAPLCRDGLGLRRQYREARRAALIAQGAG